MSQCTRRQILKTALAAGGAAAGLAFPACKAVGRIFGANDAIRVAVVGLHSRGRDHLAKVLAIKGFRVAALCDVDPAVLAGAVMIA